MEEEDMVLNLHGEVPSDADKVRTTQFGEYDVRKLTRRTEHLNPQC